MIEAKEKGRRLATDKSQGYRREENILSDKLVPPHLPADVWTQYPTVHDGAGSVHRALDS